jgi:hypothetical protein
MMVCYGIPLSTFVSCDNGAHFSASRVLRTEYPFEWIDESASQVVFVTFLFSLTF